MQKKIQTKARKKQLRLIAIVIIILIVLYAFFEVIEDTVVEGGPITSSAVIDLVLFVTQSMTSAVKSWGYAGIFGLMLLESSSLPIPSEVILPFAGYLVSTGYLDFWIVVLLSTLAGVMGALIDYYIGLKGAKGLIEHKILGVKILSAEQLESANLWFNKHGPISVFISRLIPGFRTTFSFPAGAARMPIKKFIIYTTGGCLIWNLLLVLLGYFLGIHWQQVAGVTQYIVILAVVAATVWVLIYLVSKRRNKAKITKQVSTGMNML